jgi:hypothetical protein
MVLVRHLGMLQVGLPSKRGVVRGVGLPLQTAAPCWVGWCQTWERAAGCAARAAGAVLGVLRGFGGSAVPVVGGPKMSGRSYIARQCMPKSCG